MRIRLRPAHDLPTLASIYDRPYRSAERGDDHIERVRVTAGLCAGLMQRYGLTTLTDLSCGDGELPEMVRHLVPGIGLWLGDMAAAPGLHVTGPIEETLESFKHTDLFLCSETLEHLDDPADVLRRNHGKADWLALTTPIGEYLPENPEHYWGWDLGDVLTMLIQANWHPKTSGIFEPSPGYYRFQLWGCKG